MVLHEDTLKDSTQKLLELFNEFSKVAGYKINIQNLFPFCILTMIYYKRNIKIKYLLKSHPPPIFSHPSRKTLRSPMQYTIKKAKSHTHSSKGTYQYLKPNICSPKAEIF